MSERTLVPIFFFWAVLTIVTPTLILMSAENSKADHDANGNYTSEGMKARRMMSYTLDDIIRTLRPPQPSPAAKSMVAAEEQEQEQASSSANLEAPEPASAPTPSSGNSTRATLRGSSSHSLHLSS